MPPHPTITLEPVDSVSITTLVDNVTDMLMQDQGPAKRIGLTSEGERPLVSAAFLEGGATVDQPLAEHGFSALITLTKGGRTRRVLFDAGVTPTGMVDNMRRLSVSPKDVEAIVLSHGHFDHTAGLDGFVREVGRPNLPVIIHPDFWTRRRISIPGRDPFELPSTSKTALLGAGFDVVEERHPSFLL
ncbi:MAG TPA: MBL fold metallo-hydrolase, partial [Dehalococcoidia bacterium]|nr:MBL fold metallo-hydrolase [Dehalococcoidia bacterium]